MEAEAERNAHDNACGCNECEMNLFNGEADEDNDGGASVLAAWKKSVHKARINKALFQVRDGEVWIRSWLQRDRDYEAKRAREAAELQARKDAYVHIEGTSPWLEYGEVPASLRSRLLEVPGVEGVAAVQSAPTKPIACVVAVKWSFPELNEAQRDAHFRLILQAYGFADCTAKEVTLVSA